ncbi:MAG: hypothetical protein IT249_06980 [Chitinophagaceae bacterium]|nr:hypothetical protein [Chitinophagaceae bacterium]
MKIAHLLAQYLFQSKKMHLQGIGEFFLDNFYENPFENEKGKSKVPENTIRFTADKKCREDNGLIEFISANTKKIKPLAASDLEDFLNIGKQLLNVSKQFYIEGLGTLILNDRGGLEFLQGNEIFVSPAVDENILPKAKAKKEEQHEDLDFEKNYPGNRPSGNTLKKVVVTIAFAAGIFIIGWIGWYFFNQWKESKASTQSNVENIKPVLPAPVSQTDSLTATKQVATDSLNTTEIVDTAVNTYNVIIETANKARALYRSAELKKIGYPVQISTLDSVSFNIYTTINGPISDSAKVLDSISKFFGRKAKIASK